MAPTTPVTAAGGVVFEQNGNEEPNVLLIYRRGVWDLPKGKIEKGETIKECAVREVAEEIGVSTLPEVGQKLTETYHEYQEDGTEYGKTTHWYSMQLTNSTKSIFEPATEEGIEKVAWQPFSVALEIVGYDNLVHVLTALKETIKRSES